VKQIGNKMVPREKLIKALEALEALQQRDTLHPSIVESHEIDRKNRELLIRSGWLREIMRGWYLLVRPDAPTQESTLWYAHFWEFLAVYLQKHYREDYCLSAEASLDVLLEKPNTPKQVVIISTKGGSGAPKALPYETSLLIYSDPKNIPSEKVSVQDLQVMSLPFALCKVAAVFFRTSPIDAEIALKSIKSASELSQIILKYDLKSVGERLVGAYQFLGLQKIAVQLQTELEAFGMHLVPYNPFNQEKPLLRAIRPTSPYTGRIEAMWSKLRDPIIDIFPKPRGIFDNIPLYFEQLEKVYVQDAYHSLSIEGFQVSAELIERVRNNAWNPDLYPEDFEKRNALAARGYYEAFQAVKKTLHDIFQTERNPGEILEYQLQTWFRALFAPSARAGIITEQSLLGYRNHRVHIRNSRHVPPPPEAVVDAMETFFDCLKNEMNPSVRAVLGHYIFVFIHPYMDGNGRIGRFLMNALFAAGGYPWVIVPLDLRSTYMSALEIAGVNSDIGPFTHFLASLLQGNTK
jgi:hypothetical protein